MVFTGNKALGPNSFFEGVGSGGAIGMRKGGFLIVRNSTIDNNIAEQEGAGIFFQRSGGGLVVQDSTISNNSITPETGGTYPFYERWGGAGIFCNGTPSGPHRPGSRTIVIMNSRLRTIHHQARAAVRRLSIGWHRAGSNSTISGNTAGATGALSVAVVPAISGTFTLELQNSIVSGNANVNAPTSNNTGIRILRHRPSPRSARNRVHHVWNQCKQPGIWYEPDGGL